MPTIHAAPVLLPPLIICLALIATPATRRRVQAAWRRPVTFTVLVTYAFAVAAVTVFPIIVRPPEFWLGEPWWTVIHWIPFYVDPASMVLNVVMLIPYGVLLPLLWPGTGTVRRIALLAFGTSATIELIQLILGLTLYSRRTVDVNDLIANTAGALLGLVMLRLAEATSTAEPTVHR